MTARSVLESDIGDFESFTREHRRQRTTNKHKAPTSVAKTTIATDRGAASRQAPADGFFLSCVSHVAFHQKIRRAFLANGLFRFDDTRRDIDIKQVDNIVTIDINVAVAPEAKAVALEVWVQLRQRMLDAEWGLELDEVVFNRETQHLHILFGSDKLFNKRLTL